MPSHPLEVWGGIECTIARIDDQWRNQIQETGHGQRSRDLEAIRGLGIETLRYPVLMEAVAPDHPEQCNWAWHDERFALMRQLGLRPIAGLLHHGSGPRYTSLLDPALPDLLAGYAEKIARRYPWIDLFTPVNEPLTTARFSALYGHWYPHATDFTLFLQAVLIQCKATVLAMRAIRRVNARAQLVQTEDVGRTFSTPLLQAQADFENERRWLSLDLLCGRVDRQHAWHKIMRQHGISERDIDFFRENDTAPDVIGVNHYLTSERYLDEDIRRYPKHLHGQSGPQIFADAEAVRIKDLPPGSLGAAARLREVWSRYGLPVAITEVHHGCTREEQLRWLWEVWHAAVQVRREGVDVRAVTVWALFGAFDWNSLLTKKRGFYETGAFDVRAPTPRPTALAAATRGLAQLGDFAHPVLQTKGWWHRDERCYGYVETSRIRNEDTDVRPLLIHGDSPLAEAFARICAVRGIHCVTAAGADARAPTDQISPRMLELKSPWAVVDAGFEPFALFEPDRVQAAARVSCNLARACAELGLPFVTFSSDQVFDGKLGRPYLESDQTSPAGPAGCLHLRHEQDCAAANSAALIIRTGPLINAWDPGSFAMRLLAEGTSGRLPPFEDAEMSPAYAPDLVHTVLDFLIDGESGIWHLPNNGRISMVGLAMQLAGNAELRPPPVTSRQLFRRRVPLESARGWPMPSLSDALSRFGRDALLERRPGGLLAAE